MKLLAIIIVCACFYSGWKAHEKKEWLKTKWKDFLKKLHRKADNI